MTSRSSATLVWSTAIADANRLLAVPGCSFPGLRRGRVRAGGRAVRRNARAAAGGAGRPGAGRRSVVRAGARGRSGGQARSSEPPCQRRSAAGEPRGFAPSAGDRGEPGTDRAGRVDAQIHGAGVQAERGAGARWLHLQGAPRRDSGAARAAGGRSGGARSAGEARSAEHRPPAGAGDRACRSRGGPCGPGAGQVEARSEEPAGAGFRARLRHLLRARRMGAGGPAGGEPAAAREHQGALLRARACGGRPADRAKYRRDLRRLRRADSGGRELRFAARGVHSAGHLQPRHAREAGVHDRGAPGAGGCDPAQARPAGRRRAQTSNRRGATRRRWPNGVGCRDSAA